ncbi:hypothetical protein OBBRIDRAFT_884174 [Obba rivulosa]|uniref:RING-type domain-containing protein n=1 Tax=Obba rivulosa TaxID=1052685 RepID=A0A8E2J5M9_9APHY|nr:hypothetical protein OBBRIDRAFT_884174 [Obba rivulosa]
MSTYSYVDNPNVNLVCCICRTAFVEPCTARTCCHTFCYDCIARAIGVSQQCPIDRLPLTLHDLVPADPLVRNLVDELMVECPHREKGCSHECQRSLLSTHLKDTCEFTEVQCTHEQCRVWIARKDIGQHMRCHSSDTRTSQPPTAKQTEATNDNVQPVTQEATSGLSEVSAQTTPRTDNSLATENAMLRMRLSALEGVVHSLHRQMQAVQRALGPWYRFEDDISSVPDLVEVAGPTTATSAHDISDTRAPRAFHTDAHARAGETSAGENHVPVPTRATRHAESMSSLPPARTPADAAELDLASYFPSVDEENVYDRQLPQLEGRRERRPTIAGTPQRPYTQAQAPAPTLSPPFASPLSPTNYSPVAYSPLPTFSPNPSYTAPPVPPAGAGISIPPLDPTTPLPNTLASLHGALVTLAGALGGIASARTAEALRTGEELRGLRAAMHGLRMQVHDLLTARAVQAGRDPSVLVQAGGPAISAVEGGAISGIGIGAPPWVAYGPRPPMAAYLPPMPASITKL